MIIDPASSALFFHTAILNDLGDADAVAGGATVHVGAFPNGLFDPANGPFDPDTDSGYIGPPRLTSAPSAFTTNQ